VQLPLIRFDLFQDAEERLRRLAECRDDTHQIMVSRSRRIGSKLRAGVGAANTQIRMMS
jgi:hypothetical protein